MRHPLWVNSALLLLVILLAAAVWFTTEQPDKDQNITLTRLTPSQVSQIVIENSSGPAIHFSRKPDGWIMIQPSSSKTDQAKIENLLQITRTKSIRRFEAPQDLTDFGLNPAQAVVTLNQTRIEMGTLHPMNKRRYLRIGNMIHLTNDRFSHLMQGTPKYFTKQAN